MPSPINITNIPAPRVEFIDPRTGLMSREWYRFFFNLFNLTGGGSNDTSLSDLQIGPPVYDLTGQIAQISDSAQLAAMSDQAEVVLGQLGLVYDQAQLASMIAQYEQATLNLQNQFDTAPAAPQLGTIASYNLDGSPVAGGVGYGTGSAVAFTPAGTSGQFLTSAAAGTPTWTTPSSVAVTSFSAGTTGLTPSSATTGAVTLAGTLTAVNGGTGQSSYAVGDLLYASTTTALSKLADVATGNALISGGVGVAPSYGKIGLTTHVSGILPVANGGTNASVAGIAAFNNITGYTAAGATGTTSTNLVFSTNPTLVTPILGTPQSGDFSTGTFTWPTFNQNTTGSAAKWTTARTLAGNSVDGSANVAFANKFIVQGTTDTGLSGAQFLGALGTGIVKNTTTTGALSIAAAATDYVAPSAYASANGLTMATSRLLGRTTALSGAAEEISVAGGLTLTGGVLTGTSGTVTAVSVASANGFAGTSSGGATPALTLSTTITGVLKGNGTAISAATAGTDYSAGTSALTTGILKSTTTTGALSIAVAADFPTLNQNTTGTAAGLSATLVATSGGTGQSTYTLGDTLYSNAANTLAKLAGNITATKQFLSQTGTGTVSAAPVWSAVSKSDVGLGNVENTALSTWAGSTNITTLGTVATGTWSATTIAANKGGTGQTAYAIGDLLYADTASTLAKLADVATGNALISGGVGVAPAWGKIGLTTHVSGTLPVANGGTGTATAFTTGSILFAGASGVYSQDNAQFFWDDTNNRLGIGLSAPAAKLQVFGGTDTTYSPNVFNTRLTGDSSATSGNSGSGISFQGYTTGTTGISDLAFISGIKENTTDTNYAGALVFGTRTNGSGGGNFERMRILSSGNVGIGASTPSQKLTIIGNQLIAGTNDNTYSPASITITNNGLNGALGGSPASLIAGISGSALNTGVAYLDTAKGGVGAVVPLAFKVDGSEKVRIDTTGNVGIGTASPSAKLDVNGDAVLLRASVSTGSYSGTTLSSSIPAKFYSGLGLYTDTASAASSTNVLAPLNSFRSGSIAATNTAVTYTDAANIYISGPPIASTNVTFTNAYSLYINSGQFRFPGDTRQSVVTTYNASTGDMYGMEQVSSAQSGTNAALRLFCSSAASSVIGFGKYTSATAFTEFARFDNNGQLGIGTTTPSALLEVANSSGVFNYVSTVATGSGNGPVYFGQKARGAVTAPTAVLSGDTLVYFSGGGYNGTNYTGSRGFMSVLASENWTGPANGADVAFSATPTGSTTASEKMRITGAGNVGIGTSTNLSTLTVNGSFASKSPSSVNAATYTVAATDGSLRFTTTNCTVTLPAASSFPGRILYLNTITANSVVSASSNVIPLGSNTAGTAILAATLGKFAMIQSDGTNWITMMSN